jgi:hypothetical protein
MLRAWTCSSANLGALCCHQRVENVQLAAPPFCCPLNKFLSLNNTQAFQVKSAFGIQYIIASLLRLELCEMLPQSEKWRSVLRPPLPAKSLKELAPREWIRTIDRTGNNRLLYRLSYRGKRGITVRNCSKKLNNVANSGLPVG